MLQTDSIANVSPNSNSSVVLLEGELTSEVVPSDGRSPVGVCAAGRLKGSLDGPFEYVADRLEAADAPGVVFLTGVTVIHDRDGDLEIRDFAILNTSPESEGELAGLCQVRGLTRRWAGAAGYMQTFGTFSLAAGGRERYSGKLLLPAGTTPRKTAVS